MAFDIAAGFFQIVHARGLPVLIGAEGKLQKHAEKKKVDQIILLLPALLPFQLGDDVLERIAQTAQVGGDEIRHFLPQEGLKIRALVKKGVDGDGALFLLAAEFQIQNGAGLSRRNLQPVDEAGVDEDELIGGQGDLLPVAEDGAGAAGHVHDLTACMGMRAHVKFGQGQGVKCRDGNAGIFSSVNAVAVHGRPPLFSAPAFAANAQTWLSGCFFVAYHHYFQLIIKK